MRKVLLLLTLLLGFSAYTIAQNYTEVVYLKNGSIIKGIIIEQVPDKSLKIQTADGSIYVYEMSEVTKITKEPAYNRNNRYDRRTYEDYKTRNSLRGYKGFIDFGYVINASDYDAGRVEFTTSHGYQFNNYFFIGGGMGLNYFHDLEAASVPVFANFRANFSNKRITPYGDIKLGGALGDDVCGFYCSISLGVRFKLEKRRAINISLGYVDQGITDFEYYYYDNHNNYWGYDDVDLHGISLKLGFEF